MDAVAGFEKSAGSFVPQVVESQVVDFEDVARTGERGTDDGLDLFFINIVQIQYVGNVGLISVALLSPHAV